MKTSKVGLFLIKSFEGLHDGDLTEIGLQPKMCPAGIWTEGYGHAMRDAKGDFIKGKMNKILAYSLRGVKTAAEAEILLSKDIQVFELIVMRRIKKALNQNQFDALVSHTFNTGGSDTLFKLVDCDPMDEEKISEWFTTRYIIGGGKVLPGLVRRRKAERDLFFKK